MRGGWRVRPALAAVRLCYAFLPFAVLLVLVCTGFGPPVLTDGGYPPLRLTPDDIARLMATKQPVQLSAASALLVDLEAGQTLYALRPDEPRPPASTAKLMTALIVLQRVSLDGTVTVSATAAGTEGSRMGLVAGETLTIRDLMYGLLVASGNDAAVALAEHIAGSETDFVALMNDAALAMGLSATRFANAHGLDAEGMTSSATDLLVLARAALEYPAFVEIIATRSLEVAGRSLTNTNELLGVYPGADGIKTGTTDEAGECLVASVSRSGHRIVAVILGSANRYADVRALLDFAEAGWRWEMVALPDDALAWELGPADRFYRLHSADSSAIFLPAWQWSLLQPVRRLDATVPLTSTLPVGTLEWVLADQVVATMPLRVMGGP
jgi:serine-type D-Ala-D-Ala carboxypeptidase (penicillin-binding protein 5/6)